MRDQHRLRTKKKLLDRKTEEAVSLAQNSGRSDLIPLWCQAPDNIRPPPPSPQPRSEAIPLEDLEALDARKKEKKKNKNKNKKACHESLGSPHAEGAGSVVGEGIPKETAPPPEQATLPDTADNEPPPEQAPLPSTADTGEDQWLFSLTDRMSQLGQSFKVPEGWQNFTEEEFNLFSTDALADAGINQSQLPEGWTTVIKRRNRKHMHTLPNAPKFLVGTMHNYQHVQGPEDQWEWEVSIHAHIHNLRSDDTFDVLENLPPIPSNTEIPETVPQDVPDDVDDEEWTSEMSRCISDLQS